MEKGRVLWVWTFVLVLATTALHASPTTVMDATLHNGSLTSDNVSGYWAYSATMPYGPAYIPSGWSLVSGTGNIWTAASFVQPGTYTKAVNNTGEQVSANRQFTVQANLGGSDGTNPTVNVYATQNADGTGTKVLLVSVSRTGHTSDGYTLFTVSNTGYGFGPSVAGYYVQVELNGGGYYDNIVVTSDVSTSMMIMNSTYHNGGLTSGGAGYWYNTPTAIPAGWTEITQYMYSAGGGTWVQAGTVAKAVNNTGEQITANRQFTVQADLGGGTTPTVNVYAAQNADGTGTKILLVSVSRTGLPEDGYNLFTVSNTGAGFGSIVAGYYIQVEINGGGNYDNIVVTSSPATSMTIMNASLHNGSLTANALGYWYNTPDAIPAGWTETVQYMFTGALFLQAGTYATAVNNTGEIVLANQKFTVQADLGGSEGCTPHVNVYATQNADGTGTKVLLVSLTRTSGAGEGYTLFTVSNTGSGFGASVVGYYVQVELSGGGYYDNIVVTSSLATSMTIMNGSLHNGSLTSESVGAFWFNTPSAIPVGWTETTQYMYTAALFIQAGTGAQAVNNTGEQVLDNQTFTVQADLGGGTTPTVRVYATQYADGTGTKALLVSVSRAGQPEDGYNLFTVSNTGAGMGSDYVGYYIQVMLDGDGNYDNIMVTSDLASATPPAIVTIMDADLHNGSFTSTGGSGFWSDPNAQPSEWSSTDLARTYTAATKFIMSDAPYEIDIFNNTGERVWEGYQYKIQADLGGVTGATANAFVYATQNADGTGNKVLLAGVSRAGNDEDGYSLFTVSGMGGPAIASIADYYVQVMLVTTGAEDLNAYYDNIVVKAYRPSVTGKVILGDYFGDYTAVDVTMELRPVGGGATRTEHPTLASDGTFGLPDNVTAGTYNIAIKATHWLRQVVPNITVPAASPLDPVTLVNGDINGDNSVNGTDLSAVLTALDGTGADLDGDAAVTSTDLSIVLTNLDATGSP